MVGEPVLYVAAGLFVGTLIGLTGVGGGSLMTPILMLGFGQPASLAVGTDLIFAAVTKLAATASFGYSKRVDWRIVGRLAAGSVPGAAVVIVGLSLADRSPTAADQLIGNCLAVMLAITAVAMVFQSFFQRSGVRQTAASLGRSERYKVALTVLTGVLLGVGVTLTSVGAGALGVVALLYLYPLRLSADRLVATDIAHALPVTIIGGLGHAALGHVQLPVLGCLLLGSIPGVLIGARTTLRLPEAVTRGLIAIMLAIVAGRMLLK
jgi:uncharacterized membrane protein YfcA